MQLQDNKNILLNQIIIDSSSFLFKELIPPFQQDNKFPQYLSIDDHSNICWLSIDYSLNILVNNRFKDTNIYYADGRVGLGRNPLFNYKVDIAVPKNTLMTAFHVGDGSYGFSMGNGTNDGFLSEVIGMACNKDDAGLFFVGTTVQPDDDTTNKIPLIVLDGRTVYGKLKNRPVLGISNCDYYNCIVTIDGEGNIFANDLIINNISLNKKIKELEEEINELKKRVKTCC